MCSCKVPCTLSICICSLGCGWERSTHHNEAERTSDHEAAGTNAPLWEGKRRHSQPQTQPPPAQRQQTPGQPHMPHAPQYPWGLGGGGLAMYAYAQICCSNARGYRCLQARSMHLQDCSTDFPSQLGSVRVSAAIRHGIENHKCISQQNECVKGCLCPIRLTAAGRCAISCLELPSPSPPF